MAQYARFHFKLCLLGCDTCIFGLLFFFSPELLFHPNFIRKVNYLTAFGQLTIFIVFVA